MASVTRMLFFVGFIHDYGEEALHLADALRVTDGEYFSSFDYLRDGSFATRKTDMSELYKFRLPAYVPSGLIMRFVGAGDFTLALWFIACSVGTVYVTYRIGSIVYDRATGLLAALVLAFFPFDIIWSSRINADGVLSLFLHSAILVLLAAKPTGNNSWRLLFFTAGLLLGLAYVTKIVALILVPPLVAIALWRAGKRQLPIFIAGFLVVFLAENLFYYQLTGEPFLHYRTAVGGIEKNVFEVFPMERWASVGPVTFHRYIDPWFFLKLLTASTETFGRNGYFFVWGWLGLFGLFYSLRRRRWVAPLIFIYLYLYFELGPSLIRFTSAGLDYYQIFKEPKYFLIVVPLVSLLCGYLLRELAGLRWGWTFVGVAILLALSVRATWSIYREYRPALGDVRQAASFLAQKNPEEPIYVDPLNTDLYLRLFSGDRLADVRILPEGSVLQHRSFVLVGGSRGLHTSPSILQAYYQDRFPVLADRLLEGREEPPRFSLVREFTTETYFPDYQPLRIYRVESQPEIIPPPPVLEIGVQWISEDEVLLNGFVGRQGEGDQVRMSVFIDGVRYRRNFSFPLTLPLWRHERHTIRVVATDSYGSTTESMLRVDP